MATQIYKLDFPSGKSYIGVERIGRCGSRYKDHALSAKNGKMTRLCTAWRKYGPPKQTILAIVEDAQALITEQRAVATFKTMSPKGYNMTPGGDFNPMNVPEIRHNPETNLKRSTSRSIAEARMTAAQKAARSKKMWRTRRINGTDHWSCDTPPGFCKGNVPWNTGIPHSKKTRRKIAKSLSVKKTKRRMSEARKSYWVQWHTLGKQISDETRFKMSQSQHLRQVNNPVTAAERKRMRKAQLKRYALCPMTEETKRKISVAKTRRNV